MPGESQLSRASKQSTTIELLRTVTTTLGERVTNSPLAQLAQKIQNIGVVATQTSAFTRVGRLILSWVRCSFLYRWLTAEPDPQVIVIDLRETYSVGPFIRMLDKVIAGLADIGQQSRLYRGGIEAVEAVRRAPLRVAGFVIAIAAIANIVFLTVTSSVAPVELTLHAVVFVAGVVATQLRVPLAAIADARTVQVIVAAFEPPEPSEECDTDQRRQE